MAEVIGRDGALLVAAAFGGGRLYIPGQCPDDHPLVELLGRLRADALCEQFSAAYAGIEIRVPLGPFAQIHVTRARVTAMLLAGVPTDVIATTLRIDRSNVNRARVRLLAARKQRAAEDLKIGRT